MPSTLRYSIDVFALFAGGLTISGWVMDDLPIRSIDLRSTGIAGGQQPIPSYGKMESPDVALAFGQSAERVRFAEKFVFDGSNEALADACLVIEYDWGGTTIIPKLGHARENPSSALTSQFWAALLKAPVGRLLEIGSRARSGIVRRELVPSTWSYTGLDVVHGPNVDLVGDVHEVSSLFPKSSFQAVMAFSVLEHLLMPWKMIIELNHVLATGALGLFTTHQCWPLHDQPQDFWRFSDRAWDALLNRVTGFEIIKAGMGEPAYVVAQRCHPVTNFGLQQGGFLASSVLFRKIGPTELQWPVSTNDIIDTAYPGGNLVTPIVETVGRMT